MLKVKGHALVRDDPLSHDARLLRLGNKHADEYARLGTSMRPSDQEANDRFVKSASLSHVCKCLARTMRAALPSSRLTWIPELDGHDVVQSANRMRCVRRLRAAKTAKALKFAKCRPAVGHRLWIVGLFHVLQHVRSARV